MLDPVKQNVLYPYKYMSDFEKFKEELPSREKFYSLTGKKITDKEYELVLEVCDKFEIKTMKVSESLSRLVHNMRCFVVIKCFWKI